MKLTKETLKRIIKEEMSALIKELGEPSFGNPEDPRDDMYRSITGHGPEDSMHNPLMALQAALEGDREEMVKFEFSPVDNGRLRIDTTTQSGSDTFDVILGDKGQLLVNGNIEGDGSANAAAAYLLNL